MGYVILAFRGNKRRSNKKPIELQNYYQIKIFTIFMLFSEEALSYILLILMIYLASSKMKIFNFKKHGFE